MISQAAKRTEPATGTPAIPNPPSYRPNFVVHMTNAAAALDARITWLSSDYVARVTCDRRETTIVGYHFPLNNAAACALADDKSATAEVLGYFDVPHVRHALIRFGAGGVHSADSLVAEIDRVADLYGFPLVLKPHRGTGGQGVTRVDSQEAMVAALTCLRVQYQALAASPWVDITGEYRIVVLDDQAQLIFEKVREVADGEWRNNLKFGSVPVIAEDHPLRGELTAMALRAAGALGLRFGAVDVVTSRAGLGVLEINSGVCLERFSTFSTNHFDRAGAIYARALRKCLSPAAS